jgi:hypothetical protein
MTDGDKAAAAALAAAYCAAQNKTEIHDYLRVYVSFLRALEAQTEAAKKPAS